MMAKRKVSRRRTRSHPVTKRELVENNPVMAETIATKMAPYKNLAIVITSIAGAVYVGWSLWGMTVGTLVDRHAMDGAIKDQNVVLDNKINAVKIEVGGKIEDTKKEVVTNQNTIKTEITGSIGELSKALNSVAKNQSAAAMDQAEVQQRLAFTQKQTLQGQLAVVNQALVKDPNDQLALTRKMQLEDFIKQNDVYMQDAQQKMTRLRSGQ
jgi:hypothetical protein